MEERAHGNPVWAVLKQMAALVLGYISGGLTTAVKYAKQIVVAVLAVVLVLGMGVSYMVQMGKAAVQSLFVYHFLSSPEYGELGEDYHGDPDFHIVDPSEEGDYLIAQLTGGIGYISQGYHGTGNGAGVDIAAAKGTPVRALYDGTVSYYLWKDEHGALSSLGAVAFLRTENTVAIYAHLSGFDTAESAALIAGLGSVQVFSPHTREFQYSRAVSKGDVVGYIGNTGYSFGNHLHFGLQVNGSPVNPLTVELESIE